MRIAVTVETMWYAIVPDTLDFGFSGIFNALPSYHLKEQAFYAQSTSWSGQY